MSVEEFGAWRGELLAIHLVQDEDDSVPQDEVERRWNRFVELADMVDGGEGPSVASTLVAALRADQDYSGQVLQLVALLSDPDDLAAFSAGLDQLESRLRNQVVALIAEHEQGTLSWQNWWHRVAATQVISAPAAPDRRDAGVAVPAGTARGIGPGGAHLAGRPPDHLLPAGIRRWAMPLTDESDLRRKRPAGARRRPTHRRVFAALRRPSTVNHRSPASETASDLRTATVRCTAGP